MATKAVDACPIMGPEVARKLGGVRGMASVAGPKEVREMHKVSREARAAAADRDRAGNGA